MESTLSDYGLHALHPPKRSPDLDPIEQANSMVKATMWKSMRLSGIRRPTQEQIVQHGYAAVKYLNQTKANRLKFRHMIESMYCDVDSGDYNGSRWHRCIASEGKAIDVFRRRQAAAARAAAAGSQSSESSDSDE